jgi:hypothetical protein
MTGRKLVEMSKLTNGIILFLTVLRKVLYKLVNKTEANIPPCNTIKDRMEVARDLHFRKKTAPDVECLK